MSPSILGFAALACLPMAAIVLARWHVLKGGMDREARRAYLLASLGLLGGLWLALIPLLAFKARLGLPGLAWFALAIAAVLGVARALRRRKEGGREASSRGAED
jgi:cytochrome oxidase assembly protein ShyY1